MDRGVAMASRLGQRILARAPGGAQDLATRTFERRLRSSPLKAGVALVYHAVGDPPGDPRRELVPNHGLRLFQAQVSYARDRYRIVRASELLPAAAERRPGQPFPIAITFDDDLACHRQSASILNALGVTATFFLCGATLERRFEFWWQSLQSAFDRGALDRRVAATLIGSRLPKRISLRPTNILHRVAAEIEELPAARRAEISRTLARLVDTNAGDPGLRADDVRALCIAGFELGFHTAGHSRLDLLADEQLNRALVDGRGRLESAFGGSLATISYPHGKANRKVAERARAAGYRHGFTGAAGTATGSSDPLLIGRVSPSFRSRSDFSLQVASALEGALTRA